MSSRLLANVHVWMEAIFNILYSCLVISSMNSSCHISGNMSNAIVESGFLNEFPWTPQGVHCPHCNNFFERLGPRGHRLILHGQKSIIKPLSLHKHYTHWSRGVSLIVSPGLQAWPEVAGTIYPKLFYGGWGTNQEEMMVHLTSYGWTSATMINSWMSQTLDLKV